MASNDKTEKAKPSTSETTGLSAIATSTPGSMVVEEKITGSDEFIRLRVITSDLNNEVHFRVKSSTVLGRLKKSYCSRLGLQVEELRFVFDGHRITDNDTPNSLGMMNDDVIEIYQERTGGHYMYLDVEH